MIRAFIFALFLAGCATDSQIQSVMWVRPTTLESVREICENPRVLGCQRRKNGICYVVAMDYGGDTLTTLGHELKHCFDGAWHPVNGIISNQAKE